MFYILGITIIFLINQRIITSMTQYNKIKIPTTLLSNTNIFINKQRLHNSFLRMLINSDYKKIKHQIIILNNYTKEKINNSYQTFLTNYYNNCQHFYSIDETDLFIIDNVVQIIL
jgi:hypothetical protein